MCFRPAAAKLNRCPKCGKVNKPVATVCIDCGAELAPGKEPCPQCNTMIDPMAVCPSCGYVPEMPCPKCGTKNPITNAQCAKCGFKAPQTPGGPGVAPKMPPAPGQAGAPLPPKAPPVPPKAPPAPPTPPKKAEE